MLAHREKVPKGSATAKALDYSLKRWAALTRYLDDGCLPIDNNRVENLIRPWAVSEEGLDTGNQETSRPQVRPAITGALQETGHALSHRR